MQIIYLHLKTKIYIAIYKQWSFLFTLEKIVRATETASSGETTLKRPIELLTEIIPVFCTACNKSCEQFKSDDTAKAEFVKYEAAIEKIKACEDVEERNECIKVANEILGRERFF